jgi:putative SOS response-associated peptidase YedK
MCNYTANTTNKKTLIEKYKRELKRSDLEPNTGFFLNGFSFPNLNIIKTEEPDLIDVGKWGLVPSKINTSKAANEYAVYTLNAKSETVFELPSFKDAIRPKRCLIAASGFFEWSHLGKGKYLNKYPHYIYLKDEKVLSFGGLYDTWTEKETGKQTTTFSIITVPANPLMAKIYNTKERMPLIFTRENENNWLNPNLSDSDIKELMQPLNEKYMSAHTIKKIDPKHIDPLDEKLIAPFEYPELTAINKLF